MIEHNLFYYPYASFTNAQLPLLKVAVLNFDKLVILDPAGALGDHWCSLPSPRCRAVARRGIMRTQSPPGAEWLLDWRDGKKSLQENGLHYLLTT